ncbi:hypothetical protein [Nitrososphaera sp.]
MVRIKGLRACPVCPGCGGKKFSIVRRDDDDNRKSVTVECLSCGRQITV